MKSKGSVSLILAGLFLWGISSEGFTATQQVTLAGIVTKVSQSGIKQTFRDSRNTAASDWGSSGPYRFEFIFKEGRTINPDKSEVNYTSGHFEYIDTTGKFLSVHPYLSEVRKDRLIFMIDVDRSTVNPSQPPYPIYPNISYEVIEYN